MGKNFILLLALISFNNLLNAQDLFEKYKIDYDRLRKQEKHDSALVVAKQMNDWALKNETDTSLMYAVSLRYVGECFKSLNSQDSSLIYYDKALNVLKLKARTNHLEYATLAHLIGSIYTGIPKYDLAESYLKDALLILSLTTGENNSDYALVQNKLGILYWKMGEYSRSENYLLKALHLRKILFGTQNKDYVKSLRNIGTLYTDTGEFDSAKVYLEKSLLLSREIFPANDIEMSIALNNMGVLYWSMEDFETAEFYYSKSLNISSIHAEKDPLGHSMSLNNTGFLLWNIGDFNSALTYHLRALEIRRKSVGENHPDYAMSLNNIGQCYQSMGKYKIAENYLTEALDKRKKILGIDHRYYSLSLTNLSLLMYEEKQYEQAERNLKLSLDIIEKSLGRTHYEYALNLKYLGDIYSALAKFDSSEIFYKSSLEIIEKLFGRNHAQYLNTENFLSKVLLKTDREEMAIAILTKNLALKTNQISDNFEWLNDNQKEAYWKKESAFYDNLSWFASEAFEKVPEAVGLNYNAALVTKSKMLETKISSENYYREVDELRDELAYRRRLLAKMESDGSTDKEKLEKLRNESDSLDKRLTLSWPEYAQQKKNLSITWDQVQQNLDKEEAAIEFVRFKNEDDSLYYYNALVLKKGDKNPTLIKLCKEKELQEIKPKMGYSAYYSLVWQPLDIVLKDVKTIYYAPSGELYNVPFHAIYAPKGNGDEVLAAKTDKRGVIIQNERAATEQNAEYLMDRYTMHQLTSTRYLAMSLKQKAKETIGNTMAMVGGVNYDYLPGSTASPKKNKKDKNANRSSASTSGKLNYLEGTKTEVEQINNKVTSATWQTKLIENNEAIEENITKLEGKEAKGILHLATHGYAFAEHDFNDTTINKNSLRYSYRYSVNPMVRSGLILAGGNWAWIGSDTLSKLGAEQNGILTALEVSQLNLKKTKLVVLSACETGLGKIEGSEGTFGLKRGFKLAGVEQMIVSLWSVPDKETMELMTLFYSDLTESLNPISSFEKAQKEMRNKYPTEPEKWAGFVLVR